MKVVVIRDALHGVVVERDPHIVGIPKLADDGVRWRVRWQFCRAPRNQRCHCRLVVGGNAHVSVGIPICVTAVDPVGRDVAVPPQIPVPGRQAKEIALEATDAGDLPAANEFVNQTTGVPSEPLSTAEWQVRYPVPSNEHGVLGHSGRVDSSGGGSARRNPTGLLQA